MMSYLCTKEWTEPKLTRILVPLQGFPAEVDHIQLAFNLAEKSKAKVSLLHCRERIRRSKMTLVNRLFKYAKSLSKSMKVPFEEERVTRVRASDAILSSSQEKDCDMIIMSIAQTQADKRLLGSTARRVARKSKIPVLIVTSWIDDFEANYRANLKKILVPIRNTRKDQVALRLAASLKGSSAAANAELIALNVTSLPQVMNSTPLGTPELKVQRELFTDDVSIFSEQTGLTLTPEHLGARNVGEAALKFAEKEKVDLIILGAHRKPGRIGLFLGSVSQVIATKSSRPVVIPFLS